MSDATDVLQAIDQLRRDLSGYHGQLKAHNDLQRHCDHQRERIAELEAIHARDKAKNAKMRELVAKYSAAAKYLCGFSHCNECNLDCASVFGDVPSGWDCARMLLDKKARDLGVEVDG